MPVITPPILAALRSQRPHTAKLTWYLAIAPYGDPCFYARVNNVAAAKGDRDIIYDNDVGEANVQAGMTLWVGSAPDTYDVGKVRVRSINVGANTITVAENQDIAWADDLYLTCPGSYGFRELWGVYPRITEAGGVVTFYEDYDELYNDPGDDVIPPKANAGPPVCAFVGTGGYVDIAFVGDESFTTEVGFAIAAYAWDFADGVVQSGGANQAGTCENPNVVRFTGTGFRYVSLTVTDNTAQARTGTMYVPVWIFNRTTAAPASVEVLSQSADPSWKLTVKAYTTETNVEDVYYNYPDGALVVLFAEAEWPDGTTDIGGECYRSNVRFVGWLDAESLTYDYQAGTIQFSAISNDLRLKQLPGFAYTLEDDATPGDWYEINDLNIDRALHAHLERRTTANQICHTERMNEATRTISVQAFPDTSLYDQAQEHLLKDAMCMMLADKQGILRVRRDPQFMGAADRNAVDVAVTLLWATPPNGDILNDMDETRPHQDQLGYVRLGGFAYETPLLSEAPGVAPSQSEAATYTEGFIVEDQAELNLWSALWWEKENAPYRDIPIELLGYWPGFDPAFQEYVRLTATDPLGRNVFDADRFIVRRVTFRDLVRDGTAVTSLVLEKEAPLSLGETVTIPIPPPPEHPPPPPAITPITIPPPEIAIVHNRARIYSTADFDVLNPTWTDITGAITGVGWIMAAEVDHYDGVGAWALIGTWNSDSNDLGAGVGLWRTDDVTVGAPVWNLVFTQAQGSANRPPYPAGGCDGLTAQPTWGQLRSLNPTASGECLVFEARWHGLGTTIVDATMVYRVDSVGGFVVANGDIFVSPSPYDPVWLYSCAKCSDDAPDHAGSEVFEYGMYVNQSDKRGSHQTYVNEYGIICPAGIYHAYDIDNYCSNSASCVCAGCKQYRPWPWHPGAACIQGLDGSTHVIFHGGQFYAQSQLALGATAGAIYSYNGGELDNDLWNSYAFCNICSHFDHYYYCKQINAVTARANELYVDGIASGVTSDLLFGGNGAGYAAGVIGHIRAIWDEDGTVVLVRKDQPDVLQPDSHVIWTWDPVNGLQDKTGNLTGVTWYGTGNAQPPGAWNHRFDNVGFSAFGVPLK